MNDSHASQSARTQVKEGQRATVEVASYSILNFNYIRYLYNTSHPGPELCRFAGLALLPRVCSSDAVVEYRDVYEAVSLDFLWRLLVPLRDPRFIATIDSVDDVHKQLLGVSIALSVLSLLSRDAAVAKDSNLFELIPCLTRLVRARSMAAACGKSDATDGHCSRPYDVHKDALELLWNMCSAAEEAAAIARQSCTVSAASQWLKQYFMIQPASSSQCSLSLMFIILQPCLELTRARPRAVAGSTNQIEYPESLQEVLSAIEGTCYICATDCSVMTAASVASDLSDRLDCLELTNNSSPSKNEAQSIQLQGFSILAALIPCLSSDVRSEKPHVSSAAHSWSEDLRVAVHRALRSRLPLHHLLHVMAALQSLLELEGAHGLIFTSERAQQSDHGSLSLLALVVQVMKVHVYSHLQGCVLHIQSAESTSWLPDNLQLSEAVFTVALRLLSKIVDLVMIMDEAGDACGDTYERKASVEGAVPEAANNEGVLVEVLRALQESASAMLDFIAFVTGGCVIDGPEPEQIPPGFRAVAETYAAEMKSGHIQTQGERHKSDFAEDEPARVSAFHAKCPPSIAAQDDVGWEHRTVKACCHSVGMLLSLTGGVDTCTQLLDVLPDLCAWVCRTGVREGAATLREQVAPVECLISALYSMRILHVSGDTVAKVCDTTLQKPEVFVAVGLSGIMMMKHCQSPGAEVAALWPRILSSQVAVGCELIASLIRKQGHQEQQSVEDMYTKVRQSGHNDSTEALFLRLFAAGNELQCSLGAALQAHARSSLHSAADVAAVVNAVGAVADVTVAAMSAILEVRTCEILEPICNALGVVRLMLGCVLAAVSENYGHLIAVVVSAGKMDSTCWAAVDEHILFAYIDQAFDVGPLVEQCCAICASIASAVELVPAPTDQAFEATWFCRCLQDDATFQLLLKALEEQGSSLSLAHALRMLAKVIRS